MESIVRYILKQYLDDYISGLDGRICCSTRDGVVTLRNVKLRREALESATDAPSSLEIEGGTIGSLQFKAVRLGKVQVVASDVVFDFTFKPIKAILEDTAGSSLMQKMHEFWEAGSTLWEGPEQTLELGPATNVGFAYRDTAVPAYCSAHLEPEDRQTGPACAAECNVCRGSVRTNYAQCTLCPYCSERERRCVICGEPEHEFIQVRRRGAAQRRGEVIGKSPLPALGAKQIQQVQPETVDDHPLSDAECGQCCDRGEREPEPEDVPLRAEGRFSDGTPRATAACSRIKHRWPEKMRL